MHSRASSLYLEGMKVFLIFGGLFLVLLSGLFALSFSMGKISLFSPVDGQVYLSGKALAWVEIVRQSHSRWFDGYEGASSTQEGTPKYFTETTTTDKDGKFHFDERTPSLNMARLFGWLPHEPFIDQSITLRHDGNEYILFEWTKRNYDTNGELQIWKYVDQNGKIQDKSPYKPPYSRDNPDPNFDTSLSLKAFSRPISLECDLSDTTEKAYNKEWNELPVGDYFHGICTLK